MDLKVYTKQEVKQPKGSEYYYVPNIIDIEPSVSIAGDGHEVLDGCTLFEDDKDLIEQECALATIWQRGLDPVSPEVGVRWSEVLLGEVNVVQLMEDLREAVADVTLNVTVVFDTVTDSKGNSVLQYSLRAVA
jgi:hypothetical protein